MDKLCPVCRGGVPPNAKINSCAACGLAWTEGKSAGEPLYSPGAEEDIYYSSKRRLFSFCLEVLEKLSPGKGKLLDIGAAYGDFMSAAIDGGWQAEGVEISSIPAAAAIKRGLTVYFDPVEELSLSENSYAAVTAFEVFSQMDKPAAAAAEVFRLLKPGGVFYAREFNAGFHLPLHALEARGFFKPLGLSPSIIHNFNFRALTLRVMLERAGFTEIRVRNSPPTSGDPYRTGGRLGGFLTAGLKVLYYWLAQAVWLATFGKVLAGSTLIVTGRKPHK